VIRLLWFLLALLLTETEPDDHEPDDADLDEPDDEPIRDPLKKLKAREEQVARLAMKLDRKDKEIARLAKRVEELEATGGGAEIVAALRQENAFMRSAIASGHHTIDLDTAFTLMTSKGFIDAVEITDDGEVEGMDQAFERMAARYPWLVDTDIPEDDEPDRPLGRSGRPVGAKRDKGGKQPDNAGLAMRFPALRNRVRAPR
jgi:hypothetical protein